MVALNQHGEIADILDVNQFIPGRSAYECVAYSAALLKYCGQPEHGPTGSALQASNLAQYWYGREEGSNLASNTNGMSLDAEYTMLEGMGMHYQASLPTVASVKGWLAVGYPLIICGAETGMHDIELGGAVPYSWTPSGNHAIVASGIAHDGNLLVHDCASIAPTGVRTGPRTYDASKLQLVSATAIAVPWMPPIPSDPTHMEVNVIIDLNTPHMSDYFALVNGNQWQRKNAPNGKTIILHGDMLKYYQTNGCVPYCGFSSAGLPLSNELKIEQFGSEFAKLAGSGITVQFFERAVWIYDPNHVIDHPLNAGTVYPLHLYQLPGQDPEVTKLLTQVATMQAQLTTQQATITAQEAQIAQLQQQTTSNPDPIAAIHAVQAAVAPFK